MLKNAYLCIFMKNKIMEAIEFNDYYRDILFTIPLFRDLNSHIKNKLLEELDFNLFDINKDEIIAEQGEACCRL